MIKEPGFLDEKDQKSIDLHPITDGVGFHKPFSPLPDFLLQDQWDFDDKETYQKILSILENPDWEMKAHLVNPLTKKSEEPKSSTHSLASVVQPDIGLDDLKSKPLSESLLQPVLGKVFSLKSILIDSLFISLLFFPVFLLFVLFTQNQFFLALYSLWPKILITFILFSQVYCLLCRLFCFETGGEYFSHRRLCRTSVNQSAVHPIWLFWRFVVCSLTGVVTLPLISLCFRTDLLGLFTGLYFYKTKT